MLAKQLVQLRKQKTRLMGMGAQMKGIGMQATSMQSSVTMTNAMASSAKVMGNMNAQIDPAKMAAIMQQFSEANMKMELAQETSE